MYKTDLLFFDTETTGLDLSKNELIEIGMIRVKAGTYEVLAENQILIKPTHLETADPKALSMNGYNEAEWKDALTLEEGMKEFLTYTEQTILVGHNLVFDWLQIKKAIDQVGLKENFHYKGLDTVSIGWEKFQGMGGFRYHSLREFANFFEIDMGTAHRALDDARTTYKVFLKLLEYGKNK